MGNPLEFLKALLSDGGLVLCAAFFGYIVIIVVPYTRRRPTTPGDPQGFLWHFMIPCLNEERVIERTVRRLISDFPNCHVWCIDDDSTDNTGPLLAAMAAGCSRVHVVSRTLPHARQGKGPALNAGWQALSSSRSPDVNPAEVIVGVVDGDGRLDVRCLELVAGSSFFGDPTVGAVQIQVRVVNVGAESGPRSSARDRLIVQLQDVEFRTVIGAIQTFRKRVGSAGMGGNGQFTRLSVLDRIGAEHGAPWKKSLIEDFELGVHVLLSGSRTEYCHDTFVEQQGPPSFRGLVRQRSRWGQGLMQCIRYLPSILRSPSITNGAAMELTYCLLLPWAQLFGGIATIASIVIFATAALTAAAGPSAWMSTVGWGLIPLFFVFGLAPLTVWGPVHRATADPDLSRRRGLVLGLANWPYTYVHHIAIWWAFGRILGSRHDWKKTERELDPSTPTPVLVSFPAMSPVTARADGASAAGIAFHALPTVARGAQTPTADDWEQAVVYYVPRHGRSPSGVAHRPRDHSAVASKRSVPTKDGQDLVSAGAIPASVAYSHKREEA